jgi:hypothetical protein
MLLVELITRFNNDVLVQRSPSYRGWKSFSVKTFRSVIFLRYDRMHYPKSQHKSARRWGSLLLGRFVWDAKRATSLILSVLYVEVRRLVDQASLSMTSFGLQKVFFPNKQIVNPNSNQSHTKQLALREISLWNEISYRILANISSINRLDKYPLNCKNEGKRLVF